VEAKVSYESTDGVTSSMGRITLYFLLNLLAVLPLTGCSDHTSTAMWEDYASRIGNVFDSDIDLSKGTALVIKLPAKNQRQHTLQPPNISLLQFLKLYQCEVNTLVAQRNGPLGKVMLPSQTLIYVSQFIPMAKQCLAASSINTENTEALTEAIGFYQKNRHLYFDNALFHDEFAGLFHAAHLWPMGEHFPASGVPGLGVWLKLKQQMQADNWPTIDLNEQELETALHSLQQGPLAGQWLQEIHQASRYLTAMTTSMNAHKGLCLYSQQSVEKTALLNVFRLFFTQKAQPWISQLNRFGQSFEKQLGSLAATQPAVQNFFQATFVTQHSPWQTFQKHWQAHVKAWQRHLNQCQSMPGQNR